MRDLDELGIKHTVPNPPPSVKKKDIRALEKTIGKKLLHAYVEFLTYSNGGYPMLDSFPVGGLEMSVNNFFYVSSKKQANITVESVQWHYDHRWEGAEKEILPIAGDGVGNLICLDMSESGNGRVIMWIHDPLLPIQHVADSFEAFLDLLEPYIEEG